MNLDNDYHFISIKELEEPLVTGIQKGVNTRVSAGDYSLIIADAYTGNFPAVAFWLALNRRYQELNYPAIPGVFLRPLSTQAFGYKPLNDQLTDQQPNRLTVSNRALIVTEYIYSGKNCEMINESMSEREIVTDVLSAMAEMPTEIYKNETIVTGDIYIGKISNTSPELCYSPRLKRLPWQFNNRALLKISTTTKYRRNAQEDMIHLSNSLYQALL